MVWGDPSHPNVGKIALVGRRRKPAEIVGVCVRSRKGPVGGQIVEFTQYRVKYLDSGTIKVYRDDEAKFEILSSLRALGLIGGR